MGQRMGFTYLPLSRALRDSGGDPDRVWHFLGLQDWVDSEPMREVAARNPALLENIRAVYRDAVHPSGFLKIGRLAALDADMWPEWNLAPEDSRHLAERKACRPFWSDTPEGSGHVVVFLWLVESWESLTGRAVWYCSNGRPSGAAWRLHGVELVPDFEQGWLILASDLEGMRLDLLREEILQKQVRPFCVEEQEVNAHTWCLDNILRILGQARQGGLDVLAITSF